LTYYKPVPEIVKLEFPKEDQDYIDAMIAGKPTQKLVNYWTKKGLNVQYKTKWYTCPVLKDRLRTIQIKYQIGMCHICQSMPLYKLIWKLDGINLVEYYCQEHLDKITT
jgi:hypothetical protein